MEGGKGKRKGKKVTKGAGKLAPCPRK